MLVKQLSFRLGLPSTFFSTGRMIKEGFWSKIIPRMYTCKLDSRLELHHKFFS